jgi:hypothetical protein
MSLPLHDLGSVKVSEQAHSYLRARATKRVMDVTALVREIVELHVADELGVFSMADKLHEAKGLGKIVGDGV